MKLRLAGRLSFLALLIFLATMVLPVSPVEAAKYSVTPISDQMSIQSAGIKLNRYSHLVWEDMFSVEGYSNYSLWLYRGGAKTAIPADATQSHSFLDLNDHDQVVWTQEWYFSPSVHYSDVYLYSGGSSGKITDASFDHINHSGPRINNLGTIIWYESGVSTSRMALRNSAGGISYAAAFVDGEHGAPRINDRDEVVWSGNEGSPHSFPRKAWKKVDIFSFIQGYSGGAKAGKSIISRRRRCVHLGVMGGSWNPY